MKFGKRFGLVVSLLILSTVVVLQASPFVKGDEGYIYGKITMRNGNTYQGVIRWGKEEALWTDIFNSTKVDDVFDQYLDDADGVRDLKREIRYGSRDRSKRRIFDKGNIRINFGGDLTHQFKCRFGDIQKLQLRGKESVRLFLKNGEQIRLSGGSNDVGATIKVLDPELDEVSLKWRRIALIEFMQAPEKLEKTFGDPLYGEVKTRDGTLNGFIQWDHDENLTEDVLDGEADDGDMEILFGKIRSIEKYRRGSKVVLKSGREFYLTGSNDVNSENRGILVKDPDLGIVDVPWREFDSVTFMDNSKISVPGYSTYAVAKVLTGTVITEDGENFTGRLYYDLDEAMDMELLDGKDQDVDYLIPFRNVQKIIPDGRWGSEIVLKNNKTLFLEDSRDVDSDNDGVIVQSDNQLKYIPWNDIKEILFK